MDATRLHENQSSDRRVFRANAILMISLVLKCLVGALAVLVIALLSRSRSFFGMAKRRSSLLGAVLVFGLACPASYARDGGQCASVANHKAVSRLMQRVQREHLYTNWTTLQCLDVEIEGCTARRVDIVIREQHDQKCGGDPDTSPVVDRFRVSKPAGTIQWYDVVNDDYLPFAKAHSVGQR